MPSCFTAPADLAGIIVADPVLRQHHHAAPPAWVRGMPGQAVFEGVHDLADPGCQGRGNPGVIRSTQSMRPRG